MKSVPFLPVFFTCLGIALTGAIAYRIQTYRVERSDVPTTAGPESVPIAAEQIAGEMRTPPPTVTDHNEIRVVPAMDRKVIHSAAENAPPADDIGRVFERVWFEPKGIRTGQAGALNVRTRPGSTITALNVTLENATRTARMPIDCAAGVESSWQCKVVVPVCIACGRWNIKEMNARRADGTAMAIAAGHPLIGSAGVHLSGDQCDGSPPRLHGLSVDQTDVADDGTGGDILFVLNVADDYCGLAVISGHAESPLGEKVPFTATPSGDENSWAARQIITRATTRGKWKVGTVQLRDRAGNVATYSATDPQLKNAVFEIR